MIALWFSTVALAECVTPVTTDGFRGDLSAAEAAYASADADGLAAAVAASGADVACLREAITPGDATRLYAVRGLHHSVRGETAAETAAFRSALEIDPTWTLSEAIVPADHPVHAEIAVARDAPPPTLAPLPAPRDGWLVIDGRRGDRAPTDRPYVVQWLDGTGAVRLGALVEAGQAPPTWPAAGGAREGGGGVAGLAVLAGGVAAAGGGAGLYFATAGAWRTHSGELVAADQEAYLRQLAPAHYASLGLIGLGGAAIAGGIVVQLTPAHASVGLRGRW